MANYATLICRRSTFAVSMWASYIYVLYVIHNNINFLKALTNEDSDRYNSIFIGGMC